MDRVVDKLNGRGRKPAKWRVPDDFEPVEDDFDRCDFHALVRECVSRTISAVWRQS